ncbi:MAG: TatD family hydrolase [Planctomycetaceae bacterium]|jgi:TatD DNase family protein|nr:TatD family hydrolase [Planctomycetaceae bacterium]
MKTDNIITVFDTHAHLDSDVFDVDRDDLFLRLGQTQEIGGQLVAMAGVILPGTDLLSSQRCVDFALLSSDFYSAVGIHPNSSMDSIDLDWRGVEKLAEREDVIAIGETGLDRYRDFTPMEKQVDLFCRHIDLSIRLGKPILIHCRDAWDDVLPILRRSKGLTGVIHSFNGDSEQAKEVLDLGFYVSFAAQSTYPDGKFNILREVAKIIPAERLLIETDSPYLVPHPFRGQLKRNEPSYVIMVAKKLAELRQEPLENIAQITTQNAKKIVCRK